MRLHALLCWYDEQPEHLARCLMGLKRLGVGRVTAVDGAYALYPDGRPASDPNQHAALVLAARQLGLELTLHIPTQPWAGNEVAKRTALFQLAHALADPGDWYCVMDTDMTPDAATIPTDLHARLQQTDRQVAEVTVRDIPAVHANQPNWPKTFRFPMFYRAQPITVKGNHHTYIGHDGTPLWDGGDGKGGNTEPRLDLTDLTVDHWPHLRTPTRLDRKLHYYLKRDNAAGEHADCSCGQPAPVKVETNWRITDIGPTADIRFACPRCAKRIRTKALRQMQDLDIDPATVTHRYGQAPDIQGPGGTPPRENREPALTAPQSAFLSPPPGTRPR